MLAEFRAEADAHGSRVDLAWVWTAPGEERPHLRLLRRRRAYPRRPDDGLCVLDLADPLWTPNRTWARVRRTLYLGRNVDAESGPYQAEMALFFAAPDSDVPAQVAVAYHDPAADVLRVVRIAEISRLRLEQVADSPWQSVDTLQVFAAPGGGAHELVGQIVVFTGHQDGVSPDRFTWAPAGDAAVDVEFARAVTQETTVTLAEALDPNCGDWKRRMVVEDAGLEPEEVYYYALFAPDPAAPGTYRSERTWRALAPATGRYGLDERLYDLLPALHKQYDEPSPNVRGQGELRRYLQIFGLALDQMRSLAEGLKARHDVLNVRADLLPYLARWIGWEPDLTADEITQRRDILFAPRVYRTVGTIPNVRALVNRVTGWDCRVKEFVHNVLLTNAPEAIRLWELWERRHDGSAWGDPVPVTRTDGFDGRPAAVVGGGAVWLFWHSDRSGRREIWMQRLGGVDPAPLKAAQGAPDDVPEAAHTDECPAAAADGAQVWLAWSSNRAEHWDIWVRSYDGLPGSAPAPLTEHPAEDRHPAIVRDGSGHMWVFWQSNRRGPVDIWARVYDGSEWGAPARVTTAGFRHETPAAVVDDSGRIWLFWSATLGERRNLWCQVYDAGWGTPVQITEGAQRDESPAAILRDGEIWLFWHSNRDGGWQIWGRVHDGAGWQAPFRVTTHVTADKEPAALLVPDGSPGSELRLTWRSQRRGTGYRSRTIDTGDAGVLARLGTFEDRSHYTYDTGRENDDWYARDAVGLYLTPDTEDHEAIEQQLERVQGFVEPFRPLPVRYVWILDWLVHEEIIDIRGLIREEYADEVL